MLVVLVAAVTLASVAAAGPGATKQRVAITIEGLPNGRFVLTPFKAGALKRDSGAGSTNTTRDAPIRCLQTQLDCTDLVGGGV